MLPSIQTDKKNMTKLTKKLLPRDGGGIHLINIQPIDATNCIYDSNFGSLHDKYA